MLLRFRHRSPRAPDTPYPRCRQGNPRHTPNPKPQKPSLRVGVKLEGTKFSNILDITEDKPAADYTQLHDQGITVLINPKSASYLAGTVIDFQNTPTARGFPFRNPNTLPD